MICENRPGSFGDSRGRMPFPLTLGRTRRLPYGARAKVKLPNVFNYCLKLICSFLLFFALPRRQRTCLDFLFVNYGYLCADEFDISWLWLRLRAILCGFEWLRLLLLFGVSRIVCHHWVRQLPLSFCPNLRSLWCQSASTQRLLAAWM